VTRAASYGEPMTKEFNEYLITVSHARRAYRVGRDPDARGLHKMLWETGAAHTSGCSRGRVGSRAVATLGRSRIAHS